MKLFDKIKDLFTDEIIEEREEIVEIKEEKRNPSINRQEKKEEIIEKDIKNLSENDLFKDFSNLESDKEDKIENINNNNFRFPIAFEEDDLLDEKLFGNQNIMQREKQKINVVPEKKELYSNTKKEEKISMFRVSPVISPVYGILDKNYKKEEVQPKAVKSKDITRNSTKVDFESVRKKAYGSLIDDIKENLSAPKVEEKEGKKFEDFYNLQEDINEITFGDAESNFEDFGVTIDDYKKEEKEDSIKIVSFDEKEPAAEKIEINETFIKTNKQEDDFEETNEEDIFNLIDTMMKKEEEENDD